MRLARRLLVVAVFGAAFYLAWRFAMDNSGAVIIKTPVFQDIEVLLWIALLAAFALGAVLTGLGAAYQAARLGLLARRYRKIIRRLESEVHQLRNLPLADDEPEQGEPVSGPETAPPSRRPLGRGA
jgi:ABC-type multidrug transport system fused ATPase/permease subunit